MIQEVSKAIENGAVTLIAGLVYDALEAGDHPDAILNEDIIPAICHVFEQYHAKLVSLSSLLFSIRTMKLGIEALKPLLPKDCVTAHGRYAITATEVRLNELGDELGNDLIAILRDCLAPENTLADINNSSRQPSASGTVIRCRFKHPRAAFRRHAQA